MDGMKIKDERDGGEEGAIHLWTVSRKVLTFVLTSVRK